MHLGTRASAHAHTHKHTHFRQRKNNSLLRASLCTRTRAHTRTCTHTHTRTYKHTHTSHRVTTSPCAERDLARCLLCTSTWNTLLCTSSSKFLYYKCVCICTCIHMHMYVYMHIRVCICGYTHIYRRERECVRERKRQGEGARERDCVCVYVCVCQWLISPNQSQLHDQVSFTKETFFSRTLFQQRPGQFESLLIVHTPYEYAPYAWVPE